MSDTTRPGRSSRTTTLGILAVAVALVPATWFGVRHWLIDDTAEPVTTDEAVAEFRAATATSTTAAPPAPTAARPTAPTVTSTLPAAPGASTTVVPAVTAPPTTEPRPALPELGVYRYATVGFETVDALGGTRHDYPSETTITVTSDGCGVRLRWDALRERREEWMLCTSASGVEVQPDSIQYHEFFGQGEEELVRCTRSILVGGASPETSPIDQDCFRVDEAWLPVWQHLGTTTLEVDGRQVDVAHVRQQVVDDDEYWEDTTIDWFLAPNGLPVRISNTKASKSPTFVGDVVYTEEYELTLVSLDPIT